MGITRVVTLLVAGLLLAGCAPGKPATSGRELGSPGAPATVQRPLHIGLIQEPAVLAGKFGGGGSGIADYKFLFAAKLVHYNELGNPVPVLAEQVPSLERGDWRSFPDGRMETTFHLRSGLQWHDGTP